MAATTKSSTARKSAARRPSGRTAAKQTSAKTGTARKTATTKVASPRARKAATTDHQVTFLFDKSTKTFDRYVVDTETPGQVVVGTVYVRKDAQKQTAKSLTVNVTF